MSTNTYDDRRGRIETYFDRTAVEAWKQLTSTDPVSSIRETVRRGREMMRELLLDWLPVVLDGQRVLDAGCGTGALACEAAIHGAEVVGVDISANLIAIARERAPARTDGGGSVKFLVGDMLGQEHGAFDHVVAMDSLIHYETADLLPALAKLAERTRSSIVFTFAPRTPALMLMHTAGLMFPRGDRAPAIVPVSVAKLTHLIETEPGLSGWAVKRTQRVSSGFYKSQAMQLVRT
jgi:magnesium-protoporphyrin O-methyltransferase